MLSKSLFWSPTFKTHGELSFIFSKFSKFFYVFEPYYVAVSPLPEVHNAFNIARIYLVMRESDYWVHSRTLV